MAEFTLIQKPTAIDKVTDDVSGATTIYNRSGSVTYAGVLIRITRGNQIIEHIDADTLVEIKSGESKDIDPTGVSGAIGVAITTRQGSIDVTAAETLIRAGNVSAVMAGNDKDSKSAKRTRGKK